MPCNTVAAECASPLRVSNDFKGTNTIAWFEALPLKLNPTTENVPSTSGFFNSSFSIAVQMLPVYSSDAPCGACTTTIR
jgi:hypothetical protein